MANQNSSIDFNNFNNESNPTKADNGHANRTLNKEDLEYVNKYVTNIRKKRLQNKEGTCFQNHFKIQSKFN